MTDWYATLNRPPLTPPNSIFSPVWTLLYIMMAAAIILYYQSPSKPHIKQTSLILALHLITNALWTPLFFGLQSPALALADILILTATGLFITYRFTKAQRWAGLLLIPYLIWISFATYLNAAFLILN